MNDQDHIQRFLFDDMAIRGEIITLQQSYQDVLAKGDYPPAIEQLLGQFLVAASLLSSLLKQDAVITVQARGNGVVSTLMAECDQQQNLRGIARGEFSAVDRQLQLGALLGDATLAITITPREGQRYQGIVKLEQDNLSACLESYFQQSEQLSSRLRICSDQQIAAGILLQQLPENDDDEQSVEDWREICALLDTLNDSEQLSLDHNEQLFRLFNQHTVRLMQRDAVRFKCSCSEQRTIDALLSMGIEELKKLAEEQQVTEITCQFCNHLYSFQRSQLEKLLNQQQQLH